jgi:hypothetical protein
MLVCAERQIGKLTAHRNSTALLFTHLRFLSRSLKIWAIAIELGARIVRLFWQRSEHAMGRVTVSNRPIICFVVEFSGRSQTQLIIKNWALKHLYAIDSVSVSLEPVKTKFISFSREMVYFSCNPPYYGMVMYTMLFRCFEECRHLIERYCGTVQGLAKPCWCRLD